jgi:hypothetical protein
MDTQRRIETNALLKGYDKASNRSRTSHGRMRPRVAANPEGM